MLFNVQSSDKNSLPVSTVEASDEKPEITLAFSHFHIYVDKLEKPEGCKILDEKINFFSVQQSASLSKGGIVCSESFDEYSIGPDQKIKELASAWSEVVNESEQHDQDPSDLCEEPAAIKLADVQTKAKVTEIDLIEAVYAAAPKEYIAVLAMEELVRGDDVELKHLKEVMGKMWRHSGGKPGYVPAETEIVLNAFTCVLLCVQGERAQGYSYSLS